MTFPRWCIYIDILGFSQVWESDQNKALGSLRELMRAIYRIGNSVYPEPPERLFAHHMGDGIAIVSDFGESSLERPIAIAVALMRSVAATGMFAAASIAEGEHADVTGCYPAEIQNDWNQFGAVHLGEGLMTISTVMGTAFIRAYRVNSDSPSGPLLTISDMHRNRIPSEILVERTKDRKGREILSIDWIRVDTKSLQRIQKASGLSIPTPSALMRAINKYCLDNKSIGQKWTQMRWLLKLT